MDIQLYLDLMKKQHDAITPQMREAIAEQSRLHDIAEDKRAVLYALDDKSIKLIQIGTEKLLSVHPQLKTILSCGDLKIDIMTHALEQAINNTADFQEITSKMKEIPELCENSALIDDIAKACYEYSDRQYETCVRMSNGRIELSRNRANTRQSTIYCLRILYKDESTLYGDICITI